MQGWRFASCRRDCVVVFRLGKRGSRRGRDDGCKPLPEACTETRGTWRFTSTLTSSSPEGAAPLIHSDLMGSKSHHRARCMHTICTNVMQWDDNENFINLYLYLVLNSKQWAIVCKIETILFPLNLFMKCMLFKCEWKYHEAPVDVPFYCCTIASRLYKTRRA